MKFAAIDIGTNATRLLIGEVDFEDPTAFIKKEAYIRVPLRLGEEVFESGFISKEKAVDFSKSMRAFKLIAEIFQVKDLRVCATSAMREAINAPEIKEYVEETTGLNMEIISGMEEAELIFSTFSLLQLDKQTSYIVIDVGGGSTEISVFENGERVASKSFRIGTLRLLKNKVSKDGWTEIQQWLIENVDITSKAHQIFATGGNINKTHKLLGGGFMEPISLRKLESLRDELNALDLSDRMSQFQLKADRADVIVPALDIYLFVLKVLGAQEIIVPKIGLVDGMIYNMYLKHTD